MCGNCKHQLTDSDGLQGSCYRKASKALVEVCTLLFPRLRGVSSWRVPVGHGWHASSTASPNRLEGHHNPQVSFLGLSVLGSASQRSSLRRKSLMIESQAVALLHVDTTYLGMSCQSSASSGH